MPNSQYDGGNSSINILSSQMTQFLSLTKYLISTCMLQLYTVTCFLFEELTCLFFNIRKKRIFVWHVLYMYYFT